MAHAVTAALLLSLLLACRPATAAYAELVVFGDSLSDTGNLASLTVIDFPWPYFDNRVSNGPLAVDVLAAQLGLSADASLHLVFADGGGNFAVDGARAAGDDPEDLVWQQQAHLARAGGTVIANALYVVMIGGNDLRDARNRDSSAAAEAVVDAAVASIRQLLDTLLQLGAEKLLVVNAPDIGRIPETLEKAQQDPAIVLRSTRLSQRFNALLGAEIATLRQLHGEALLEFDLFSYFKALLDNAVSYGFVNSEEGCFDPQSYSFHPECFSLDGIRFDRFVFFDSIHPTAKTHELIGKALHDALQEQPAAAGDALMPILWYLLR